MRTMMTKTCCLINLVAISRIQASQACDEDRVSGQKGCTAQVRWAASRNESAIRMAPELNLPHSRQMTLARTSAECKHRLVWGSKAKAAARAGHDQSFYSSLIRAVDINIHVQYFNIEHIST